MALHTPTEVETEYCPDELHLARSHQCTASIVEAERHLAAPGTCDMENQLLAMASLNSLQFCS